jgi:hypothetical protein
MKGISFFSMLAAIEELDGADAKARVVEALADPLGTAYRSGAITRVGWIPLAQYSLLHEAIQIALGGGERRARELGRRSTEIDTRGILRFVLSLTTPALLVRHADRVFGSYIRGGTISTRELGPGEYELTFSNMQDASRYVFAEWEGGIGYLLERSGAEDVSVKRAAYAADEEGRWKMIASWRTER